MKRVISIFLILIILSTVLAIFAAGFDAGGFTYTASGTNATLTGWASSSGTVTIPATVSNGGTTYKVTAIGDYAFANKPSITKVNFSGSNLTTIGEGAFSSNNKCTSLTIPASVTAIGARAFHSWVALSNITFAENSNLTTIGNRAFRNAQSLTKINFPDKASGYISIGEAAFSYCNSLAMVDFPACVSEIGEESFIGCTNLASVTIRNKDAVIGTDAFDLTASRINASEKTERILEVNGHKDSSANRFATAEKFTFKLLPNEANEEPVTIPTAGSYDVRVSYTLSSGGFGIGSISLNNTFGSRTNIITDSDTAENQCNKAAGIAVQYKNNNGKGTTTSTKCWGPTSFSTSTVTATISGFPTLLYSYANYNGSTRNITMNVTKLEVKGTGQTSYTTLWEGSLKTSSTNEPYAATVNSNGTLNAKVINSHKDTTATSNSGYTSGWASKFPTPNSLGALTGDSTATLNTDGTTYRSGEYTFGKITDQYGVQMAQNPTISLSSSSGGITGISFDKDYGRLVLTSQANRSPSTYTVSIKQTAGSKSNTKNVTVTTFDYNIIFSYTEGTKRKTVRQTVDYGSYPTDPGVTPIKYDSDGHQTFNKWSNEFNIVYKSGPQNVTVEAEYNDIVAHSFGETVESSPATCTAPQELKKTCTEDNCAYDIIEIGEPALGHTGDTSVRSTDPVDGQPGVAYYRCNRCNTCWGAVNNNGTFEKDLSTEEKAVEGKPNTANIIQNAPQENILTPAPAFNRFTDSALGGYDYSRRGAGLKISGSPDISLAESTTNPAILNTVTQGMRFTASMHIPEGVALGDTGSGNRLTDFGYVWSQTELIGAGANISNLEMGKTNVMKTSVVANNKDKGTFTGDNWIGVSAHDDTLSDGGKTLTFNLVVNVKARNWKRDYCARAYIQYIYNGVEYTVYDNGFSSRSVAYIAPLVAESSTETAKVKNYCTTKIVNNLKYIAE